MSFNRENIAWQSEDGKWNIGFFTVIEGDWTDPDYDPEWDVDYDYSTFEWVSTGHPDFDAAFDAWDGANPGGTTEYEWSPERAETCARYDEMAQALLRSR